MKTISGKDLKGDAKLVYFSAIDRELKIKFNLNALYYLEQQYGDINVALEEIKNGKIKSLISITTAALSAGKNRKEPFTEEEVADLIQVDDLKGLAKALEELLGKVKDGEESPSKDD